MAATHIECCGEVFPLETFLEDHLVSRRNTCEWTYELAAAMLHNNVQHVSHSDPAHISTTVLTSKCLRQTALDRSNTYIIRLEDLYASFRGTAVHAQLEQFISPGSYGEVRFIVPDLGKQIPWLKQALPRKNRSFSGSPDLVDPIVGLLFDYKRTKEVPRFNSVWPDHVEQLNINRWLVDHADFVSAPARASSPNPGEADDNGDGTWTYDLSKPEVRARFVPVEWQELIIVYVDDRGPKPITVTESVDVPTQAGAASPTKKVRRPTIWSDERVEEYIATKYVEAREALTAGIAPVPEGWENASHVLCGYCPVRGLCLELQHQ